MKHDTNKLFGNVRKSNKIMFTFVTFFLQVSCKSLRVFANKVSGK